MLALTSTDPTQIGPHRLLARLGAGGMGKVYLARTPAGRLAALKVVKEDLAHDGQFRARFAREVRTAQMVVGPFTPDVVDADPHANLPWMATEYVPGPTLREAVRENGPLPEPSLRVLAIGLANALQAIHTAGLMHRDLKPSNVLLSPRGPQVIDFGIARAVEGTVLTKTGQAFGTPSYTSPEQVIGHETSLASDVFSLAGVVTFAATGQPPFGRGGAAEVLPRVVGQDPRLDGVPQTLRPLLARCLAKNPAERPTADEIVHTLSTQPLPSAEHGWLPARVNQSISAHRDEAHQVVQDVSDGPLLDATTPLPRPPRRKRTGLVAAGAGVAALVLVAGVGLAVTSPWSAVGGDAVGPEGLEGLDETVEDWDGETGFDAYVDQVEFTPDGSGVYVNAGELTLWDWQSAELRHLHTPRPSSFALADDGTMAASYADTVAVFDTEHEVLAVFDLAEADDPNAEIDMDEIEDHGAVSISPDGSLVATVVFHTNNERRLYVWDWEEDTITHSTDLEEPVYETEFSSEGTYLRLRSQAYPRVTLLDAATFEEVTRFVEEEPESNTELTVINHSAVFSPSDPLLAIETEEGTISLYDYQEDQIVREIVSDRRISSLAFSGDGRVLYSAGSATAFPGPTGGGAWEVATGEELTSGDTLLVDHVSPHPEGTALATFASDTLLILDPQTFDVINEIS